MKRHATSLRGASTPTLSGLQGQNSHTNAFGSVETRRATSLQPQGTHPNLVGVVLFGLFTAVQKKILPEKDRRDHKNIIFDSLNQFNQSINH
jgi:hypothetical protein